MDLTRKLGLELEAEGVTELLEFHDQTLRDEDLLKLEEQRQVSKE